jgi:hypothetical protein
MTCTCNCNQPAPAAPEKKMAKLVMEVEFDMEYVGVTDITDAVRSAVDELNGYGAVTKAKLTLPATEMDMR